MTAVFKIYLVFFYPVEFFMLRASIMRLIFFIMSIFATSICYADTIVRFNIEQGVTVNAVDLRLYEDETPLTVSNFMSYVEDGSYDNSFIHRSVSDFIIQGGGYKYDPSIFEIAGSLSLVQKKAPIVNEPGISNLRGTIAMAKVDGDPHSATSQWFFNLADNSANLDEQNEGFTVFGEVINNGMPVIDSISLITAYDKGCIFFLGCLDQIPLIDYISGDVFISNLVRITNAEGLVRVSSDYNFGAAEPNTYQQSEFVIENISQQNILIGNMGSNDPIMLPFGISDTECNNAELLPGASCIFIVSFSPVVINSFVDSFDIEFPGLGFDYTINVSGVGILSVEDYDSDGDGVSDLIENLGANAGDGNYDGILDSQQSNVVSIPSSNGTYITLTGDSNITYQNVRFIDKSEVLNAPGNLITGLDVLEFTIGGLGLNEAVSTGMILPASINPKSIYVYGAVDTSTQEWFDFSLDATTGIGAAIVSGLSLTANDGSNIPATLVTMYLQNATRGDSDFKVDNEIKVVSGFYGSTNGDSSGQLHLAELCLLLLSIITLRFKFSFK